MSKEISKSDGGQLNSSEESKKLFQKASISIPPLQSSVSSSSSTSLPSDKHKVGSHLVAGKLAPFLARSKEKKQPSSWFSGSSKVNQIKKRFLKSSKLTSKSTPKLPIGKINKPAQMASEKTEAKSVKLESRSGSKTGTFGSLDSRGSSHTKCNQNLKAANEKLKRLEEVSKKEKLNIKSLEDKYHNALKESDMTKEVLDEKIGMITKLNESILNFEKKLSQSGKLIRSLRKENHDFKNQMEIQRMLNEKKEAELNRHIQKLEKFVKEKLEVIRSFHDEKEQLINEKRELERKVKSLEDLDEHIKNQEVGAQWMKDSNGLNQLELLSRENQALQEEIDHVKNENERLAARCETALIEKHFMNEQLGDAVDQLEIDYEEKQKLKAKLDFFKSQLTEVNEMINKEKEFTLKNYQMIDDINSENGRLKQHNQELELARVKVEKELQKVVNEKQILFEQKHKVKLAFQKMLKEVEKQKDGFQQIRKELENAKQILTTTESDDKQLDIPQLLAVYQSVENEINNVESQSELKKYFDEVDSIINNQTIPLDYKVCLQWLKEQLADKDLKLESLNLYLSQVLELAENEKMTLSHLVKEEKPQKSVVDEGVMVAMPIDREELSKALEDEKQINKELKDALKYREEEYEKQVKQTNELRAYLGESENSLYQIREEYKSLLRANEEHNKSMEYNISHKIFLENQIEMLEDKQHTLKHQIDKLKHLVEHEHEKEKSEPSHLKKVASPLNQQVDALKNEIGILTSSLEELKKEKFTLVETIEKDRVKCGEIALDLGTVRKRLNEILEIDKDKGYVHFLLEGQDAELNKFKKQVLNKLLEQSQLIKAFEKVLKELTSIKESIPEEPESTDSEPVYIIERLSEEVQALKNKLVNYKKSFQNSNNLSKRVAKMMQNHLPAKPAQKQPRTKSIIENLNTRLTYMKKRIEEVEQKSKVVDGQ